MGGPLRTILRSISLSIVLSSSALYRVPTALAAGADYDGNGFSEIPVLSQDAQGKYVWTLFDPFSGKSSVFTRGFGKPTDSLVLANWLYPKVTSAGVVSSPNAKSRGRLVWRIRTSIRNTGRSRGRVSARVFTVKEQEMYLGRRGEIIVTGGDFDGDRIADAVVITNRGGGNHKWGLRGSFFLAGYNPGLNVNRAYFDFGRIGIDRPFFLNPDGKSDWFAVTRSNGAGCEISLTQPFTKEIRSISVASVPDVGNLPVPLAQDDGSDLLVFYGTSGGSTQLEIKNLSGRNVATTTIPIVGEVTVGNYGPGAGEEIAVSSGGSFYIFNPITGRLQSLSGPAGQAADSININTVG